MDGCVDRFVIARGDVMIAGPAITSYRVSAGIRLRPGAAAAVIARLANEFREIRVPINSAFGPGGYRLIETLCSTTALSRRGTLL
jgi:hypothetical protein